MNPVDSAPASVADTNHVGAAMPTTPSTTVSVHQGRRALIVIAIGATVSLINLFISYRASPEGILP